MIEFEEFKEKFETLGYYKIEINEIELMLVYDTEYTISKKWEKYQIVEKTEVFFVLNIFCKEKDFIFSKYNTLEEAYKALKGICKLNGVEME